MAFQRACALIGSDRALMPRANSTSGRAAILRSWNSGALGHGLDCTVTALSPSDVAETEFLIRVAENMPDTKITKGSAPDLSPNDASVAIWVQVGTHSVLLGADLE